MKETGPHCPKCGRPLRKVNHVLLGWLNFTGALVSALFACWAGPAYALLALGELVISIQYFLRRGAQYSCRQCMCRYGADEVKHTGFGDRT